MAAGDATRIWFPEIVKTLSERWRTSLSMEEVVTLTRELNRTLEQLRAERGIEPPLGYCVICGELERAAPPRITVRSLIVRVAKLGIDDETAMIMMEREWSRLRHREGLDAFGEHVESLEWLPAIDVLEHGAEPDLDRLS